MIGLYKAVRDFRPDKETSSELRRALRHPADHHCHQDWTVSSTRRSTRTSRSVTRPQARSPRAIALGDALPGPGVNDPSVCVISTEELQSLVFCLGTGLSSLESQALTLYLEGNSYEDMADLLECDTKTIDNALQRVKRKILAHQKTREVLA
jgi:RNA polymerase sporulation-specific sigma factor